MSDEIQTVYCRFSEIGYVSRKFIKIFFFYFSKIDGMIDKVVTCKKACIALWVNHEVSKAPSFSTV